MSVFVTQPARSSSIRPETASVVASKKAFLTKRFVMSAMITMMKLAERKEFSQSIEFWLFLLF